MNPAVRFSDGSSDTIEGLLVPFSAPFADGKDSYRTFFTPDTRYCLDWYTSRPMLYQHGLDPDTDVTPVGRITDLSVRADAGVWLNAQLDRQSDYFDALCQMIEEDQLFLSSGSIEHLVKLDTRTGEMLQWPIVEGSLTPTPANTHAFVVQTDRFRSDAEAVGIRMDAAALARLEGEAKPGHVEAVRAALSASRAIGTPSTGYNVKKNSKGASGAGDFAYVDSKGKGHLPIGDAAHARNALARFNQTQFETTAAKTAARKKIVAACKKFGIDIAKGDKAMKSGRSAEEYVEFEPGTWHVEEDGTVQVLASALRANVASESVDYERSFEDIRNDIRDLLNPGPSWASDSYADVSATFADDMTSGYAIVCRWDDGDESWWRFSWTLDENQEPVLGDSIQMDKVFVPTAQAARSAAGPITLDAQRISRDAAALAQRTKDLATRRIQESRPLSATNTHSLTDMTAAVRAAMDEIDAALVHTNITIEAEARACDPETWKGLELELELLALTTPTGETNG